MTENKTFFGQPIGLFSIFGTGIAERFSFYTMRAMLTLFLTAAFLTGGFGMDKDTARSIYGIYLGLIYVTPILGGIVADKVLGQKICTYVGGFLMVFGQLALAISATIIVDSVDAESYWIKEYLLYIGLGLLIMGNGFFKPNLSAMVGAVYPQNDPRRDVGFTIFYMGVNIGALIAPLASGFLGESLSWKYGYLVAVFGMLVCIVWFFVSRHSTPGIGLPPNHPKAEVELTKKDISPTILWTFGNIAVTALVVYAIMEVPSNIMNWVYWTIAIGGGAYIISNVIQGTSGKTQWSRVSVIFALAIFNIIFWAGFEQAGTTLTYFANEQTERASIPASLFQSINPLFVIMLGPIMSILWTFLDRAKLNPNTPMKFAISLVLLAASFFVMDIAQGLSDVNGDGSQIIKVSALWLISVYCIQTIAELCMSPVGLSMITKLSPQKIVNVMMGLWMGSIAVGNFLAQQMNKVASAIAPQMHEFEFIAWQSLGAGIILAIIAPFLFKAMKGIN